MGAVLGSKIVPTSFYGLTSRVLFSILLFVGPKIAPRQSQEGSSGGLGPSWRASGAVLGVCWAALEGSWALSLDGLAELLSRLDGVLGCSLWLLALYGFD